MTHILLAITLGFAAGIQPGPFQTFLISRTLQDGWRHALPAAFAPLLSDILPVSLSLLVLTSLPGWMSNIVSILGGCFILFLAYSAFRSARDYSLDPAALVSSRRQNFVKAVTVNLLNPNPFLFWSLVMGPLLLKALRESIAIGVAMLSVFYGTIVFVCGAIVFLFAGVGTLFPGITRVLLGASAIALAAFGVYQLYIGMSSFSA